MTPKSARSLEYKHKRRGSTLAPGDCGRSGSSSAAKTPQPLEARVSGAEAVFTRTWYQNDAKKGLHGMALATLREF
jgi:hypothetical protein